MKKKIVPLKVWVFKLVSKKFCYVFELHIGDDNMVGDDVKTT